MKKVMIAAVILLPLIILMVLLISGTVVGSVQHIYVESIEFTEEGTLVLVKDSEEAPAGNAVRQRLSARRNEQRSRVQQFGRKRGHRR